MKRFKRSVLIYRGHPVLSSPAEPIALIDHHVEKMAKELIAIMEDKNGCGIAATQGSQPYRLFVINIKGDDKEGDPLYGPVEVMINPSFTPISEEMSIETEGCLSVPGFTGSVRRYQHIEAKWIDLRSRHHVEKMSGWRARVFQHELDHLNGIFFIDDGRLVESEYSRRDAFLRENQSRFDELNHSILMN